MLMRQESKISKVTISLDQQQKQLDTFHKVIVDPADGKILLLHKLSYIESMMFHAMMAHHNMMMGTCLSLEQNQKHLSEILK